MSFLRLQPLEERIVLDGAVAHDISQVAANEPAQTQQETHLLVISDAVADAELLADAARDDVVVLVYESENEDLNSLSAAINHAFGDIKAESIAFVSEGNSGIFSLLSSDPVSIETLETAAMKEFWRNISDYLVPNGKVNLLGANIGENDHGTEFLQALEEVLNESDTSIILHASTDETGHHELGGNWILEYSSSGDTEILNVEALYYDETALQSWQHVLLPDATLMAPSELHVSGSDVNNSSTLVENSNPKVLFVSNEIYNEELLEAAIRDNVYVISYDYYGGDSFDSLITRLETALDGREVQSIGFVTEGFSGTVELFQNNFLNMSAIESPSSSAMVTFWQEVTQNIAKGGSLDLLGCNIAGDSEGVAFLETFNQLLNLAEEEITLNASSNDTGSATYQGDWILEYSSSGESPLDTEAAYFEEQIENWDHILARTVTIVSSVSANEGDNGTTTLNFNITIGQAPVAGESVSVRVRTLEGTASSSSDFTSINNQLLTWEAGDSLTQTLSITISGDTTYEAGETLFVELYDLNWSGADWSLLNDISTGTINNDDPDPFSNVDPQYKTAEVGNYVWNDLNGNGRQNSNELGVSGVTVNLYGEVDNGSGVETILLGSTITQSDGSYVFDNLLPTGFEFNGVENPEFIFVLDRSSSARDPFDGDPVGNQNDDDLSDTIFDAQVAAYKVLIQELIDVGLGDDAMISIVTFESQFDAQSLDVDPSQSGKQLATTPNADNNNNGVADIVETLESIGRPSGGTNFEDALDKVIQVFGDLNTSPENGFVYFFSDGVADDNQDAFRGEADFLRDQGFNVTAIGIGDNASLDDLRVIDPDAFRVNSTNELLDYFRRSSIPVVNHYFIEVIKPDSTLFTVKDNSDDNRDSDVDTVTGRTDPFTLNPDQTNRTFDAGLLFVEASINDVTIVEGDNGTSNLVFTVSLSRAHTESVRVDFATANGTATTADNDYLASSGSLYFNPGETSQQVTITINGDHINESDETLLVNLSTGRNVEIDDGQGIGTIDNDDALDVTINDVTINEGNNGTTNFVFTVDLSTASDETVRVNYSLNNGTAQSGSDYANSSGTLTFVAGDTRETITVAVNGDTLNESNETFNVLLSNLVATNSLVTVTDNTGVGTIINDDALNVTINDVTINEGNNGTTNFVFTVALSAASDETLRVNYSLNNGTAQSGSDYANSSGTLTFVAGDTSETITVAVNGDTLNESNETFNVLLSNLVATNSLVTVTDNTGVGTIINDDALNVTINDVTINEGNNGTTNFVFTVALSAASDETLRVNYSLNNGTAQSGSDYANSSGTLTFVAGDTSETITVAVNGDTLNESNETFNVLLSNLVATNSLVTVTDNTGVGTIINDDALNVTINDVTINEGNNGTTNLVFTVGLSTASDETITIDYALNDGSAASGSDYVDGSGTLTFVAGDTSETITVAINGDTLNESNETFAALLSNLVATNSLVTVTDDTGLGTIINDDALNVTINDVTINEGNNGTTNFVFTVALSTASDETITVDYALNDGSAASGSDYVDGSGTLTFVAGDMSETITVAINGDTLNESNETFAALLSNLVATNSLVTVTDDTGLGTIINDDALNVTINDVTINEGNNGTTNFVFTVALSTASDETITIDYALNDGSAASGSDYVDGSGTLTFVAGDTSETITVAINGDTLNESNETFAVLLSNLVATNGLLAVTDDTGLGTIINDDALNVTINDVTINEGNNGTTNFVFTVALSTASDETITIDYALNDGSAASGSDYVDGSGTLTFVAGDTSETITVAINGDTLNESNETFAALLSNLVATNSLVTVTDDTGLGTIINDDALNVTINDVTINEGNNGTTNFVFTVALSTASDETITIDYALNDGSAASGSDYVDGSGTLTFVAGDTSETITVAINGDTLNESNETFAALLSNLVATNSLVTVTDDTGLGTIINDDALNVIINDVTINEGDSGATNFVFTVTLSTASDETITIDYALNDGSAASGSDYVDGSGTLTFVAGDTSETITVAINGDTLNESNETFAALLSNLVATNSLVTVTDDTGLGTIINDDALNVTINDVTINEGNNGTTNFVFTVALSTASDETITIDYALNDGSAVSGSDYVDGSGTLTFVAGDTSETITVAVNGNATNESDETFAVLLSNLVASNSLVSVTDDTAVGTIINDDTLAITIDDVNLAEGDSGTTNFVFTVTLSTDSDETITIDYVLNDGSAQDENGNGDYSDSSGTLTFVAGETTQTITVAVNGDITNELNETFTVLLSNLVATNRLVSVTDDTGLGTIANDDIVIIDIIGSEVEEREGSIQFTVWLSNPSDRSIILGYGVTDGSASIAERDYLLPASPSIIFLPNQTVATIDIPIIVDSIVEPDEKLLVNIYLLNRINDNDIIFNNSTAEGLIINDDTNDNVPKRDNGLDYDNDKNDSLSIYNGVQQEIDPSYIPLYSDLIADPTKSGEWSDIVIGSPLFSYDENGELQVSFIIYLTAKPEFPVTLMFEGEGLPNESISSQSLTFTPENWLLTQTVVIKDVADLLDNKNETDPRVITLPVESDDPNYRQLNPRDIKIVNS